MSPDPPSGELAETKARALRVLAGEHPRGEDGAECIGQRDVWKALHGLLSGSVKSGEGNSCLLIGQGGSGKSMVRSQGSYS